MSMVVDARLQTSSVGAALVIFVDSPNHNLKIGGEGGSLFFVRRKLYSTDIPVYI